MKVEFCESISNEEQQSIKDWLESNNPKCCQIVKINGIDYSLIILFENAQIVAIRVIK